MKGNIILGIESSCDDTSAAIVRDGILLSSVIASQKVHEKYGGVVPELASRAHQQNIVPVISEALREAGIDKADISAIAFTRGPGLLGSLLVGTSFAKGLAMSLGVPLIDVNHLHGHSLAPFIRESEEDPMPEFPYLCLLVSGGNSQIILVKSADEMEILGKTIDDAAGEAFDKCAKILRLPYPGGPHIDRLAKSGNPLAFKFGMPRVPELDYSFSGLKTSFLYTVKKGIAGDPDFIEHNLEDLAASLQKTIIDILLSKLKLAFRRYPEVRRLAIGGGVSANDGLRDGIVKLCEANGIRSMLPERKFTTDNAAMIATAGWIKYQKKVFCALDLPPYPRVII